MSKLAYCPICENILEKQFKKNGFSIGECVQCGVLAVMDQVDELNLREIYNAEYYEKDAKRYVVPSTKSRANWVRRLHLLEKCQQQTNRGKILDVGCGPGVFLEVAQRGGWDVCGIDMSPEAVFEAGGRIGADRVSNIDLLSLDTTEQYDAITMWALIEHVSNPVAYLRKAHSLLCENGILALATVNTSAFNHNVFGKNWRYFTPPEHLVYFNVNNLIETIRSVGLKEVHLSTRFNHQAFWQGVGLQNALGYGIFRKTQTVLLYPITAMLNSIMRGDIIELVARRI